MRSTLLALALLAAAGPEWEEKASRDGVTVFARERPGSPLGEFLVVGTIDAPPPVVWRVLTDYERYPEIVPHFVETRVVAVEDGSSAVHLYVIFDAPVVARRDFTERVVDESDWRDGRGYFLLRWTASEKGPPPREDMVRVTVIEGSWRLEPLDGGARTRATHFLFTDPGGSMPRFLVNMANKRSLPDTIVSLRKHAADARYQ